MITAAAKSGRSSLSLTCGLPQDPATRHAHRREGNVQTGSLSEAQASQGLPVACLTWPIEHGHCSRCGEGNPDGDRSYAEVAVTRAEKPRWVTVSMSPTRAPAAVK